MNIPIQYWEEPDKQKEVDRMQQELSAINDQYKDISYALWVLAHEGTSDKIYQDALDELSRLKNLCMKLTKEKYQLTDCVSWKEKAKS